MIDRTSPPIVGSFPDVINIQRAESHQLKNGIPLFLLRAGTQPVVKLELLFKYGGNGYEDKLGQSFIANKLLNAGTSQYSSQLISSKLAEFGASIEITPGFDSSSISLMCLEKHLIAVLPVFISMTMETSYPEEELRREKDLQITNLRIQHTKTNVKASKSFRRSIFSSEHPYGNVLHEEALEHLDQSDMHDFHKSRLLDYDIVVTGSFSDSTLLFIKEAFESVEINQVNFEKAIEVPEILPPVKLREPIDGSVQGSIRIGKRISSKNDEKYIQNLIPNHILGGYFGSRLMKNIREDKGLTYGIYSSIVSFKKASYFVVGADVKRELIDLAIDEIYKELDTLANVPIGQEELSRVKNHMIGSHQSELNSAFALSSKFKNIHEYSLGYEYYDHYLDTIKNVNPDQIMSSAKEHFSPSDMTEIVVG
ncbi:MAG: pitrilysin family protein [Bacteroidota bacterium]